ncbi:unnamed protein product [Danaus chrysippus]|uniref:(African queen) hypothetical protein n=1 Tax=Danaus chrysippus TaxID=151541 RepID=A0A8J2MDW2_9NEOP|nr:unnamed protein product [Danaus chrysippus]
MNIYSKRLRQRDSKVDKEKSAAKDKDKPETKKDNEEDCITISDDEEALVRAERVRGTHDPRFPWVSFFALSAVRAGGELTWNTTTTWVPWPGRSSTVTAGPQHVAAGCCDLPHSYTPWTSLLYKWD